MQNPLFTRSFLKRSLCLVALAAGNTCHALPFEIKPAETLPTTIVEGGMANAYYTVTNNTSTTRKDNHITYLPLNVSQTDDGGCGRSFTLTAKGTPGDTCGLELIIKGAVNAQDPDPHHHLIICFPGDKTCAGTSFPLNVSVVKPLLEGYLYGVSCFNNNCNAVGTSSTTRSDDDLPQSYISNDGGSHWNLSKTMSLPQNHLKGQIYDTACTGADCFAVGYSGRTNFQPLPVLYQSHDNGLSWMQPVTGKLPTGFEAFGQLGRVNCTTTYCLAVGLAMTEDQEHSVPLVYKNLIGTNNWVLQESIPHANGQFTDVKCTDNKCIAVGVANVEDGPMQQFKAIIYRSDDAGDHWLPSQVSPLSGQYVGEITLSVDCVDNYCHAVGLALDQDYYPSALVYRSSDYGVSWTPTILPTKTYGFLNYIKCIGAQCVAVGDEYSETIEGPLIYTTKNNGLNWTKSVMPLVPTGHKNGVLTGVDCTSLTSCVTVGYSEKEGVTSPLAYSSTNGGIDWQLAPAFPAPNRPLGLTGTKKEIRNLASNFKTILHGHKFNLWSLHHQLHKEHAN